MLINASGRCDIAAYYMPWLMNRIKAGFVDVRNPFYPSQVSRISLHKEDVEGIIFCTKNPIPILNYEEVLKDYSIMIQVTITPYRKDIEPFVPDKKKIIEAVKECSVRYGKRLVQVRYDPILLSSKYTVDYHAMMFERLCSQLNGYIDTIIISFVDEMKNIKNNAEEMGLIEINEESMRKIAERFSVIAGHYKFHLKTCAEAVDLSDYDILNEPCFGPKEYFNLTGKIKKRRKGNLRKNCDCISMADIGAYNCWLIFADIAMLIMMSRQLKRIWLRMILKVQ